MDKFLQPKACAECTTLRQRVTDLEKQNSALEKKLTDAVAERDALKAAASKAAAAAAAAPAAPAAAAAAAASTTPSTSAAAAPAASIPTEPGTTLSECATDAAFLTPRGRFKLRFCENSVVLVGKSSECNVPYSSVARLWLLPEASSVGGHLLIAGLSQPAVNGKTSVNFLTIHSKPADAPQQADLKGTALSGKPALLLRDALTHMRPDLVVTEPGNPNTGAFKPAQGVALQCVNKATECSVYLLEKEMLVREGGKATVLPYAGLRAELLPPSGRRTFDIQLECPPPSAAPAGAAAGAAPPKPVKLELSLIPAEEFSGVAALLKKKKVNVNGSRDAREGDEEGDEAEGGEGSSGAKGKKKKAAAADADSDDDEDDDEEEEDSDSDDEDDSDDEEDEDFKASDGSEPEEEYDSDGGEQVEMDDDDEPGGAAGDDDDDDEEEEEEDEEEEEEAAEAAEASAAAPPAKRAKVENPENVAPQAEA